MIRVHTTGLEGERFLKLDEVNIVSQKIDYNGKLHTSCSSTETIRWVAYMPHSMVPTGTAI
jgi:hypothetical protein